MRVVASYHRSNGFRPRRSCPFGPVSVVTQRGAWDNQTRVESRVVDDAVAHETDPQARHVDSRTIVARLEHLLADADGAEHVLAFAGDGTVWTGEVGFD